MVSIAIMGHGVVGSGVTEIITTHKNKLFNSVGEEIYIKKSHKTLSMDAIRNYYGSTAVEPDKKLRLGA